MSQASIKATFKPGDRLRVTNHYITRTDHPCYGTRDRTVTRTSSANLTLDGDSIPWHRLAIDEATGTVTISGFPNPGDLFLTLERAQWLNAPPIPDWLRDIVDAVDFNDPETWHHLAGDDEDGWS